jgi:hypothetical protein
MDLIDLLKMMWDFIKGVNDGLLWVAGNFVSLMVIGVLIAIFLIWRERNKC